MTRTDSFRDTAIALVRRATLAPSSHNTQPWRFSISDTAIDLFADRARALSANDPADRELTISCGCALFNLRAAAAEIGLDVSATILPDPAEVDWLARVELDSWHSAHEVEAQLAGVIEQRQTHRKPFARRDVPGEMASMLVKAAAVEGAWLRPIQSTQERRALGSLIAEGDAVQWSNRAWRAELAAWMRSRNDGDGITVPLLAGPITRFVVRTCNMGRSVGSKDSQLAESSPLLLVLGTDLDGTRDWMLAGQALQRVLLTARSLGMQASFLNQPVQVLTLRPRIQKLTGDGFPQIVLRVGYPSTVIAAAPRRSLKQVLLPNVGDSVHTTV